MENKIRITRGIKKIEVNDDGEFILLPVSDDGFVVRFYKLMDQISGQAEELEKQETADITGQLDLVEKIVAIERKTKQDVEDLFGEGTCRKVFGEILPSMDLFVEFFGSILPFFEEYKKERMRKMGKYGADRTGSSI